MRRQRKSAAQLDREIAHALKSGRATFIGSEKHGTPAKYLGQCDRVRSVSASNEQKWQSMMACAEKIPTRTFLEHVDFSPLLEDDETAEQYIAEATRQDDSTATYRSWWGDKRAWFIQTAGFEFIFVE